MTVDVAAGGSAVAPYDPDAFSDVGLEDIGVSDIVLPRLRIIHDEGVFEDNLSKAKYDKLTVILLGLVKQRVFWASEVDTDDKPLCKSTDFTHGFPNVSDDLPKDKRFPWQDSNFNPADYPPEKGLNGLVTLPCDACVFKEWPKDGKGGPPCAEQHTYPLMYSPDEGESWVTALLTLQKTGIKPSRQYISSFAQSKTPMFTVFTEISLNLQSRGTVKYSVPTLRRGASTDRNMWGEYAGQLRSIRDFIRQPPRLLEEEDGAVTVPTSNENSAPTASAPAPVATPSSPPPASAPAAASAAPAPPASASTDADDDGLPF